MVRSNKGPADLYNEGTEAPAEACKFLNLNERSSALGNRANLGEACKILSKRKGDCVRGSKQATFSRCHSPFGRDRSKA